MRTLNGILWLAFTGALLFLSLSCRPVAQSDIPERFIDEPVPAQVVTPTPTRTPTPTPPVTPTPPATPKPKPTVIRIPPQPQPTYPPGMDLSVPPPPPPPPKPGVSQGPAPTGIVREAQGPTTAGGNIRVAGKVIKLPDDAYIRARIESSTCGKGTCLKAPYYSIVRGKSRIAFSQIDGEVGRELIARGEAGAFDFLKDYLKRKALPPAAAPVPTVTPPAITGPATRGANIEIAGKTMKLPDDTYVDAVMVSVYCFYSSCPKAPVYRVQKGNSWIEFSAVDGEIVEEYFEVDVSARIFDSLKSLFNLKRRTAFN